MIHGPEMLILDEPTSGVDPIARASFWQSLVELARRDQVTIFISTNFMNEAERCDRISLMHAGRVLAIDAPAALVQKRGVATLEDAFIRYLQDAKDEGRAPEKKTASIAPATAPESKPGAPPKASRFFDFRRMFSYTRREALELQRDPIRLTMALLGTVILMFVMGFGISTDVENLSFAVLDRDNTQASRDYTLNLSGSRYFSEQAPITDYAQIDRRMRAGDLALAIEIPPGFGRDIAGGRPVQIGGWIDGAMPSRA